MSNRMPFDDDTGGASSKHTVGRMKYLSRATVTAYMRRTTEGY